MTVSQMVGDVSSLTVLLNLKESCPLKLHLWIGGAYVGKNGMGALVCESSPPLEYKRETSDEPIILDTIAQQVQLVFDRSTDEGSEELLALNGYASGARPKASIGVSEDHLHVIHGSLPLKEGVEPWLVKFPTTLDGLAEPQIHMIIEQTRSALAQWPMLAKQYGVTDAKTRLIAHKFGILS